MTTENAVASSEAVYARFDDWRYTAGTRTRRIVAFVIDYAMVLLLILLAVPLIGIFGLLTFGAGWLLYAILFPLVAIPYVAWTLGGPHQATIGMRLMNIRLARYDGQPIDWMTGIVHSVLFWSANVIATPAVLLVALFTRHKRTLHDLALGTVVVRTDVNG